MYTTKFRHTIKSGDTFKAMGMSGEFEDLKLRGLTKTTALSKRWERLEDLRMRGFDKRGGTVDGNDTSSIVKRTVG